MAADVQITVEPREVGNVFTRGVWGNNDMLKLIYEGSQTKIHLEFSPSTMIDDYLYESDFDRIYELKEDIEHSQGTRKSKLETDLMREYNKSRLDIYNKYGGDRFKYQEDITKDVLENFDEYVDVIYNKTYIEIYT